MSTWSYDIAITEPLRWIQFLDSIVKLVYPDQVSQNPHHSEVDLSTFVSTPRVLLVEDNVANQQVASLYLKKFGCKVDIAANGKEAVEICKHGQYDIVFMDCLMPGKSTVIGCISNGI